MDTLSAAVAVYKNRSTIKRFVKWLVIAVCCFALFACMIVGVVLSVISDGFKPPPPKAVILLIKGKH